MFRNTIIGIAGFALACAQLGAVTLNERDPKGEDKKDKIEIEKPEKPDKDEKNKHKLVAVGGSNCPVYYGCPAPAPAPKGGGGGGGGGKNPGQPQKPGIQA